MKEVECPVCKNSTVMVWSVRCCLQCGWNVKAARKTHQQVKYFPYVWIVISCLLFVGLRLDPGANSRRDINVFCGVLVALGFVLLHRLRRAKAVLANHSGDVSVGTVDAAVLHLQRQWEWLLKIPPPREVRLTKKGRRRLLRSIFSILCINLIFALFIAAHYWILHKHGPRAVRPLRPLLIFNIAGAASYTILTSGLLISYDRRARRLLAGGQAVVGKIVNSEPSSGVTVHNFEFLHPSGKVVKLKSSGRSMAYFEGMTLPVFCNPLKLKDSFVLLAGGDYEIIRPGLSDTSSQLP